MTGPPSDRAAALLGVLAHRRFAAFWAAGLASNTGTWLHVVTSTIVVYSLTGSTAALGLLGFASYLPLLLFTLPAGVLTDRVDRRRIVLVTHLGGIAAAGGLAVAVAAGAASVTLVALSGFGIYTAYAVSKPAVSSIFPGLVPAAEIPRATAINSLSYMLGQLLGPLLAAACVALGVPALAFALNALSYLAVMLVVARLPGPALDRAGGPRRSATAALREGLRYAVAEPRVRGMLVVVALTSPVPEVVRLLSPAISAGLGAGDGFAGVIAAAIGLGSALGLLSAARLYDARRLVGVVAGAAALLGAGALVLAAAPGPSLAAGAAFAVGIGYGLVFATATGHIQGILPDGLRGRVMAVHTLLHLGTRPLFTPVAGALGATVGVVGAAVGFVGLLPVAVVAAWRAARVPPPASADDGSLAGGVERA